ncbi:hypothetical protein PCANC_28583 [Puccinia coronata f. sp. avenae]|uniref:Abscisic acid G-protein coupled receptor-like domain-containing protein n=1 Tax=Puccinia coronata f. sp. avenae TaxID=200324 RepID=A0A2N5TMY1_9BASI|nr:hypothetical protein PCANC_28583 [Puccinia coronata f. sp. avenae]
MPSDLVSHLALFSLRVTFFLGCRRYLQNSLLLSTVMRSTASAQSQSHDQSTATTTPAPPPPILPPSIASLIFCWSFCEGSLLFSIVILGSWLNPPARNFNWNLSLALLISSVVFIVPFLECLLFSTTILSRPRKTNERTRTLSPRILVLTLIPFGVYLFVYYRLGQIIQGLLGVESGSHSFGFLNTTLARICVPGVILIASLSGGGAVNTAWLTWEWRRRTKEIPINDQHIAAAEKSLLRTQNELIDRKSILQQQQSSVTKSPKSDGSSLMSTLFSGSSNPKSAQLQQEIAGLEAMEAQMIFDLTLLKERKEYQEYSRTIPGMMLNIANWFLSVYCVYRLFMACVNLIFGLVRQPATTTTRNPTTDIVTYMVAKVLSTFSVELEISKLTRLVGLVLIGSIIVVNLRAVLFWVNRVLNRLTVSSNSTGLSSSLMLLVLGQLMAMYLLTCLISLPSSTPTRGAGGEVTKSDELLNTLPSFSRFSKLFDLVFLTTGSLTFLSRWLIKQIHYPDSPPAFLTSSSSGVPPTHSSDESIALNQRVGAHFV